MLCVYHITWLSVAVTSNERVLIVLIINREL
jgi:hypothetical protein